MDNFQPLEVMAPPSVSDELLDYTKAKVRIDALIGDWDHIKTLAKDNRNQRAIKLDVRRMRESGDIAQDATFAPQRVIDNNIIRDKADAMNFLSGSHRLAYFRCIDDSSMDTRPLESEFTKGLMYEGWYKDFDKHYDGAALHGWAGIKINYDETKPLHVSFDYIPFDRLFFHKRISDIQNSPIVLIEHEVTVNNLEDWVTDFGFDAEQVDRLLARNQDKKKDDQVLRIYETYYKVRKIVYVCWYSREGDVSTWLKFPEKYRCGITDMSMDPMTGQPMEVDKDVYQYPIKLYIYKEDELDSITEKMGRAFLDAPQQEAETAIVTAFVNGCLRASATYAAPSTDDGEGNKKLEEITLEPDVLLPVPINFHSKPYPDSMMLQGASYLKTTNSQSTGKMAVAVSNRKDARKTAQELELAEGEQKKLTSISLANYSEFLRGVFTIAWQIVQSQALNNKITFLAKEMPQTAQEPGMPPIEYGTQKVNDVLTIGMKYDVRAAGDVDVTQKKQIEADMQQDWPVLFPTALGPTLLEDYVRIRYPLQADRYVMLLRQGDPAKQLITALLTTLQGAIQPEELAALSPEEQSQLENLVMMATQYITGGQNPDEPRQALPTGNKSNPGGNTNPGSPQPQQGAGGK